MRLVEILLLVVAIVTAVFAWPTFADWQCRDYQRFCPSSQQLEDELAWRHATATNTRQTYEVFLERYPTSQYISVARERIAVFDEMSREIPIPTGYDANPPPLRAPAGAIRCYVNGPCFNDRGEEVARRGNRPEDLPALRAPPGAIRCYSNGGPCFNEWGEEVARR